jgi:TolB-like protein/DNA-binding winged helix-turn-helix (wHTH) protein
MVVSSANPQVLYFGSFELDLRTSQLRQQGRPLRLQDQPFQLLALLAQRPGELVDREEIRQKLWARNTFVEFDDSVNHAIRKVREALRDSAVSPRFIETVPRQGYRFIAPVQVVTDQDESQIAGSRVECRADNVATAVEKGTWHFLRDSVGRRPSTRLTVLLVGTVVLISAVVLVRRIRPEPTQISSLAVLPLENLSGDASQEYFSDGVTEAIITDLGQIKGIRVISRTSVLPFKRSSKTLPQIARDLNVDALMEGGIVRSGGRVRITAQLVAANPERHIWASSYEGDAGDIIGLQREIARAVAREIRATLSVASSAKWRAGSQIPRLMSSTFAAANILTIFMKASFPRRWNTCNALSCWTPTMRPRMRALRWPMRKWVSSL